MFKYFTPDKIYETVYEIDFDALIKKNIKALIFDIDNTLAPYSQPEPTAEIIELMQNLREKGFSVCFVSNNNKARVDLFNRAFKFPAFAEACKPFTKRMKLALKTMSVTGEQAAVIGDQLFTDICAGKRINATALLVKPVEPVESLFFKTKRVLEKPFIKRYWRLENAKKV